MYAQWVNPAQSHIPIKESYNKETYGQSCLAQGWVTRDWGGDCEAVGEGRRGHNVDIARFSHITFLTACQGFSK
jgi:hypothetical protein